MADMEVIRIGSTHEKWMKLMLHLQNSVPGVYQLSFLDAGEASSARKRMFALMERNPTWFHMVIIQRGSCVYVIKNQCIKKVVIQ